jgi:hypothetical protein
MSDISFVTFAITEFNTLGWITDTSVFTTAFINVISCNIFEILTSWDVFIACNFKAGWLDALVVLAA